MMNRCFVILLAFMPGLSMATGIRLYSGVEVMRSEVAGGQVSQDGLVVIGGDFRFGRRLGLALEAGLGDTSNNDTGAVSKGSALLLFEPLPGSRVSPVLFGGYTWASLIRQTCSIEYTQSPGFIVGSDVCRDTILETEGRSLGVGLSIKSRRGSLMLRYSIYNGNDDSSARIFGVSASF